VLEAMRVPATFFLSGRALHGLGPYWWSLLERSIRSRGLEATRRLLGLWARETTRRTASTRKSDMPADLAVALEGSPLVEQLSRLLDTRPLDTHPLETSPIETHTIETALPGAVPMSAAAPSPSLTHAQADAPPMPAEDIHALASAGMTIGFHTLRHPVLTTLPLAAQEAALSEGRRELAAAAGTAVDLLAYPHGRADASTADAAQRAGFVAAFAAGGRPITARSDRFLLARWEPGDLQGDAFAAAVAARLLRPPTPPR
jgi:peptidoglycan/xylan/chitin deacetylase (PgdA/CDA1 family)